MKSITMQHSKDLFFDFILAKMWQGYLVKDNLDDERDYDLISNDAETTRFYDSLTSKLEITPEQFKQFNIKSAKDLQKQLRQSYYNLIDNNIDFN